MTRSTSKSGPPELGEPFYSRQQQLGHLNKCFTSRMRAAIAAGRVCVVEGIDRRPGTKWPRPYDLVRGALR